MVLFPHAMPLADTWLYSSALTAQETGKLHAEYQMAVKQLIRRAQFFQDVE